MLKNPLFLLLASLITLFVGWYMGSSTIEIVASVVGIINVWLLAREKVLNFPVGIIAVGLFLYIFWGQGLYALVVLSACQIIFNIFGWYYWLTNKGEGDVSPTVRLDAKGWIIYGTVILAGWLAWGYYQVQYTESTLPYLDALTAILGLVAQFMLSKKIFENWHLWIVYNIVCIAIYIYSDLHVMIILAIVNLFICIDGLLEWRRGYMQRAAKNHA
ncbi:nicotinamide riboside transporter PnuC [Paenibacillus sp. SC116]|uniref:nicotinamide riboside transporter PnuC n=1 Tax=Paenibacillus sp. SC116 TaxID=2968986 RepID=UPI00215A7491|nr:nicotinamide riboside transporter PnuC [Paenibacillus sp. SC116]MCR8846094.1 nicotinamide riboside transporter PnuC [Paenibacillus sp. SC116]